MTSAQTKAYPRSPPTSSRPAGEGMPVLTAPNASTGAATSPDAPSDFPPPWPDVNTPQHQWRSLSNQSDPSPITQIGRPPSNMNDPRSVITPGSSPPNWKDPPIVSSPASSRANGKDTAIVTHHECYPYDGNDSPTVTQEHSLTNINDSPTSSSSLLRPR